MPSLHRPQSHRHDIPDDRMMQIFDSIGLQKIASAEGRATYAIPSWRWDLQMEVDLVEEIARLYGLDNIPARVVRVAPIP